MAQHRHHDDKAEERGQRPEQQATRHDQAPYGHRHRVYHHGVDRRRHRGEEPDVPVEQHRERDHADRQHQHGEEKTNPTPTTMSAQPALDVRSESRGTRRRGCYACTCRGLPTLATRNRRDAREQAMREKATQPDHPLIVESGFPTLYPLSRIQQRLIQSAGEIAQEDPASVLYQHTVFCQTSMPYRDPGPTVREWEREQGRASLLIEAGRVKDPQGEGWLKLGLPFGPKPRLILAHL